MKNLNDLISRISNLNDVQNVLDKILLEFSKGKINMQEYNTLTNNLCIECEGKNIVCNDLFDY
jgi:hypothetical protein